MSDRLSYWLIITCFVITAVGFFFFGRKSAIPGDFPPVEPKVDTLYLHDTITRYTPVKIRVRVVDTLRVLVPVRDTDTVAVLLPREQLEWTDSLATIWASGVQPAIDSVRHYTTTTIITKEVPVPYKVQPRWAVGVTGGYGASKDGLSPFVGVGVTFVLASW